MNAMITVRSNPYYTQEEDKEEFTLTPHLELVIIHTDGKSYELKENNLESTAKIAETRLLVSPELLQNLITDLQLQQKKLDSIRKNADQLNSLVRHITKGE